MTDSPKHHWQTRDRFLELHSRWMTLIGEHLEDHQGQTLEYWRIEKANSVIILPIQDNLILLPSASYRPGVKQITLDFPGGRIAAKQSPEEAAIATLQRELRIDPRSVAQLVPLNTDGWAVNSSFSNQKLYGFTAHLSTLPQMPEGVATTYPATLAGVQELLQRLTCLQCRAVLLEWWLHTR